MKLVYLMTKKFYIKNHDKRTSNNNYLKTIKFVVI
jgi:hypothetical protein